MMSEMHDLTAAGRADAELWDRMTALVRMMGGNSSTGRPYQEGEVIQFSSGHYETARAIVADLPVPVDPDLIEARKIAALFSYRVGTDSYDRVMNGSDDSSLNVRETLAGIKRGRELATPDTSA